VSIFLQIGLEFTAFIQHQGKSVLEIQRGQIVELKIELRFFIVFTKEAVADLALPIQKQEAIQAEHRPDHVFPDPFGLDLCPGPDPAMDIEPGVAPGENLVYNPG
jgi:hypothetical protein